LRYLRIGSRHAKSHRQGFGSGSGGCCLWEWVQDRVVSTSKKNLLVGKGLLEAGMQRGLAVKIFILDYSLRPLGEAVKRSAKVSLDSSSGMYNNQSGSTDG
jgi:hypothetical protein